MKAWEECPTPRYRIPRRRGQSRCRHDLRHRPAHPQGRSTRGQRQAHPSAMRPGTVADVGPAVQRVRAGDRVLVSCISACGSCPYCRQASQPVPRRRRMDPRPSDRRHAGPVRAGAVRGSSTYRVPDGVSDEQMILLADILPTAYEVGTLNGKVRPGDVVAIIGAGLIRAGCHYDGPSSAPATWSSSTSPTFVWRRPASWRRHRRQQRYRGIPRRPSPS